MSRKAETGTDSAWDLSSPGPWSEGGSVPSPAPPQSVMTEAEHQQALNSIPPAEGHGTLPPHLYSMLNHASHQLRAQRGPTLEAQVPGENYSIPVGLNIQHVRPLPESYRGPYQQFKPQQYHPTSQHYPPLGFYHENGTPTTSARDPGSRWVRRYPNILGHVPSGPAGGIPNPQVDSSVVLYGPLSSTVAGPGYSYNRAPRTRFGDQQSDPKRRIRMQIDYLESLALDIPTLDSVKLELQTKEAFRVRLTEIAQAAIARHAESRGLSMGPNAMSFKCFGSLRNGFALPGADMDLTMVTRASSFPKEIEAECPQILVKAFLDAGLGARLISRARIPIIKLCEKPSDEFLEALRMDLKSREESKLPDVTSPRQGRSQLSSGNARNSGGDDTACSPGDRRNMVFPTSGEGIQCDINFAGRLAIYNSELLRCYSLCDERVRLVGLFVKRWANTRKINNPYHGTLCSYGYILMVIHYLTNVVRPPVIPNLQIIYQPPPPGRSPKEVTTVDGCDVRFFNDENEIKARARANAWTENKQSLGDLLRGFFAYYGSNGRAVPLGGFDWVNSVVSIRTRGGVLTKSEKGWTTAKVDENGTRHKYLLAIEDPFEHDHNIGRTVIQSGIVAIRGEFRRAHAIINRVQDIPGVGWEWRTDRGDVGEDFFAEPENRSNFQRSHRDPRQFAQSRTSSERGLPENNSNPSTYAVGDEAVDQAPIHSKLNYRPGAHRIDDMLIPLSQQRSPANVDINRQSEQEDLPEAVAALSI